MLIELDWANVAAIVASVGAVALRYVDKKKCESELAEARRELGHLRRHIQIIGWLMPAPSQEAIAQMLKKAEA